MNQAYFGASSKGFKVSSLGQILEMRSNDGSIHLLEYLVNLFQEADPSVLNLEEEMQNIKKGSKG